MQRGRIIEKIIASFTSHFFMKDFVFLNPEYQKDGLTKELADVLLVLDSKCIVLSVKGTDGIPKSDLKLKSWLTKKTLAGSKQAKGGLDNFKKVSFAGCNLWEEFKKFDPDDLKPICGIVLLECTQKPFGSIEFKIHQLNSEIPIHCLSLNDFLNVVKWLGSIWDIFNYFSKRSHVLDAFTGINQEIPFLAYYTLRSHDLKTLKNEEKKELGKLYNLHLLNNLSKYKERDRLLNYVNSIVHELHFRHPSMENYIPPEFADRIEPEDKRVAYLKMAAMLNAIPASNKVWIGEKIENLLKGLRHSGEAGCFAFKRILNDLVFVFAIFSKLDRGERIRSIDEMLPAALYQYNTTEGLGIAFDADKPESGFDLIWYHGYNTFNEGHKRIGKFFFPNPKEALVTDPFGKSKPFLHNEKI